MSPKRISQCLHHSYPTFQSKPNSPFSKAMIPFFWIGAQGLNPLKLIPADNPIARPPMILTIVIMIPAIASPRTNLLAPSIAP